MREVVIMKKTMINDKMMLTMNYDEYHNQIDYIMNDFGDKIETIYENQRAEKMVVIINL